MAAGYDNKPGELSGAELGALIVGVAMGEKTGLIMDASRTVSQRFILYSILDLPPDSTFLGEEIGRHVYGDNDPRNSSTETHTLEADEAFEETAKCAQDNPSGAKTRCGLTPQPQ